MKDKLILLLTQDIIAKSNLTDRYMLAIAGPPASGKSTLAENLCLRINQQAEHQVSEVVPMDGFHLDNRVLDARGLRHRKGSENTFDGEGFAKMINLLRVTNEPTRIPLFDRNNDKSVPNARTISSHHRILIIEGNYLLLSAKPWSQLHTLYDYTILLKPSFKIIKERLINRWMDIGYDLESAENRALSNDIPNAEFVLENSGVADLVID